MACIGHLGGPVVDASGVTEGTSACHRQGKWLATAALFALTPDLICV
jgi:hypothetical protein